MAEDVSRAIENRPRLGRGLAALLGGTNGQHTEIARGARQTPIEFWCRCNASFMRWRGSPS